MACSQNNTHEDNHLLGRAPSPKPSRHSYRVLTNRFSLENLRRPKPFLKIKDAKRNRIPRRIFGRRSERFAGRFQTTRHPVTGYNDPLHRTPSRELSLEEEQSKFRVTPYCSSRKAGSFCQSAMSISRPTGYRLGKSPDRRRILRLARAARSATGPLARAPGPVVGRQRGLGPRP